VTSTITEDTPPAASSTKFAHSSPTDVERCMLRIRKRGAVKPWGSAVSIIEMALWDLAGKAAGPPVYNSLGGKIWDRVRSCDGAIRCKVSGLSPEDYAAEAKWIKELPHGFSFIKMGVASHSPMKHELLNFHSGELQERRSPFHGFAESALTTERGIAHLVDCVMAMKEVLGPEVGLALDCGPGFTVPDAIRFTRAVQPLNRMWLEDMLTGDYTPYVNADVYRDLTMSTDTPIHTCEQICLQ
jgi:L-alanine-DL-glutamate epimerase-like enolase superfamily enzyme